MQKLTNEKARELLKELQYAKVAMGGQLSIKDEYFKQALERMVGDLKVPELPTDLWQIGYEGVYREDFNIGAKWAISQMKEMNQ